MKTDIINKTNQSFELKEGNAGAYRFMKQLDPEAKVSIKVDPNATYREYMVATGKKGESILLTSDDFSEFKVIDIVEGPGENPGTMIYKSMTRNPRKSGKSKTLKASNVGGAGYKPKAEGASNAGVGSDPPASSPATVGSVSAVSSPPGVGPDPPASSPAAAGSGPAVSSPAGVGPDSPASSPAAAGSGPAVSSPPGVESVPAVSSPTSRKPSKNERVPWYRKPPKSWFK